MNDPEIIDPLYFYSAHPDTDSDVIVAHSVNVAIYVLKFAMSLSFPEEMVRKMGVAALLHDIGMYEIPDDIVYKREKITSREFKILKNHTHIGNNELAVVEEIDKSIPMVALEHHERIDGSGYPKGLKSLSELTELFAIIDFFEAVTHHRPQRGPVTPHAGIEMLMGLKHRVFSKKAIKSFISVFSVYPAYSIVRLSSGETGQVIRTHIDWPLRPVVRVLFDKNGQLVNWEKEIDLFIHDTLFITKDISDRVFIDNYFSINS
jgi:HD-GYP domain-containing protein (c-di-GMP phosphodiesterase class II)